MASAVFVWGDRRMGYAIKEGKMYDRVGKRWVKSYEAQIYSKGRRVRSDIFETRESARE